MSIEISHDENLDTIPTAELIAGSHFSGVQLFDMFNIDKGRCILGKIRQLRKQLPADEADRLLIRAEIKALIPEARKHWNHDMWYFNPRYRGGEGSFEIDSYDEGESKETPSEKTARKAAEQAARVTTHREWYERYTQEQLLSDGEGMESPLKEYELANQCPDDFIE